MKVGREPDADVERVRIAREAIGDTALFVDANGAYSPKQALRWADIYAEHGVTYFEEPVLRMISLGWRSCASARPTRSTSLPASTAMTCPTSTG